MACLTLVGLRCVIVDDNPRFLEASSRLLEREGITVVGTAATKRECLERAAELAPDVVLLDIALGEESGFDVCRSLAESGCPARVVLVSTQPACEYGDEVRESPAVGFLTKAELSRQAIEDLLEKTS